MADLFNLLRAHNAWWIRQELILDDEKILELDQQKYIYSLPILEQFPFGKDCILTLRGPRQVGKSTVLKLLIKKLLLELKLEKENVFFFSCDRVEDFHQLYDILIVYLNFIRPKTNERLYIFLDEISFVKEWMRAVKSLADEGKLKNVTLLLTGSNLLDLRLSSERMPGRRGRLEKLDHELLPVSFKEFVKLIRPEMSTMEQAELSLRVPVLDKLLNDFLITGGFPLAINEFYKNKFIHPYVYQLYISWIEGDVGKTGKNSRIMYQINSKLIDSLCTPISWHKLGKESGLLAHTTAQDYVEILQKMFVLRIVEFIDWQKGNIVFRKNKKIYFLDPLIFHCFYGKKQSIGDNFFAAAKNSIDDNILKAKLIENTVGEYLKRKKMDVYYWQWKKEIDFVTIGKSGVEFYEVKYQPDLVPSEFSDYRKVIGNHRLTVITKSTNIEQKGLRLIPVSLFLLS